MKVYLVVRKTTVLGQNSFPLLTNVAAFTNREAAEYSLADETQYHKDVIGYSSEHYIEEMTLSRDY